MRNAAHVNAAPRRRVLPVNAAPRRRVLFVLRGKLGDSIVSFAPVRAYTDVHPGDEVTLLVRANYLPLFAREENMRVIGFSSRLAMFATLAAMRWFEAPFDALLVLLGAGPPIATLGRLVRARRKIFLDGRFREVYPEWPESPARRLQSELAWRVVRLFASDLAQPQCSSIPSLAARRRPARAIGIAPISDEPRRTMSPQVVQALVAALGQRHPGYAIHVLVNTADAQAQPLLRAGLPAGAQFRRFPTLEALIDELGALDHLHSTDTGLYHLAAAMGVSLTTYFGPTQPWRNSFPGQPELTRVRVAAIGGEHCEEKTCQRPACLELAVAGHLAARIESDIGGTPQGCLLRPHARQALDQVKVDPAPPAVPVH